MFSFLLQYEARSRLQQLSGSNAISSADLFGEAENAHSGLLALSGLRKGVQLWRTSTRGGQGVLWSRRTPALLLLVLVGGVSIGNVLPAADIAQFKQGVKSVAGKMAVLANGVMNSLQVRLHCSTFRQVLVMFGDFYHILAVPSDFTGIIIVFSNYMESPR